jgi:hypothetical protein
MSLLSCPTKRKEPNPASTTTPAPLLTVAFSVAYGLEIFCTLFSVTRRPWVHWNVTMASSLPESRGTLMPFVPRREPRPGYDAQK